MGIYGYGTTDMSLPEDYIKTSSRDTKGNSAQSDKLHPTNPGSIYHLTKCLDQGIVWGTHIAQTQLDDRLINRFDYDGDYGTVFKRFLVQAAIGATRWPFMV